MTREYTVTYMTQFPGKDSTLLVEHDDYLYATEEDTIAYARHIDGQKGVINVDILVNGSIPLKWERAS